MSLQYIANLFGVVEDVGDVDGCRLKFIQYIGVIIVYSQYFGVVEDVGDVDGCRQPLASFFMYKPHNYVYLLINNKQFNIYLPHQILIQENAQMLENYVTITQEARLSCYLTPHHHHQTDKDEKHKVMKLVIYLIQVDGIRMATSPSSTN